jgi:hypothetical protein
MSQDEQSVIIDTKQNQQTPAEEWLLADGDIGDVIESLQGWHIANQILEAQPGYPLDPEEIEHRLHMLEKAGMGL